MLEKNLNLNKNAFWVKPIIIFVLLLVMLIPLGFIKSILYDRQVVKSQAEQSIMQPVGGTLELQGLVLSLPFKQTIDVQNDDGTITTKRVTKQILVTPKNYKISTELDPQYLKRGIFSVPIFNGNIGVNAEFEALDYEHLGVKEDDILFDEAVIILGIANKKTFTAFPKLLIASNDQTSELMQSFATPEFSPFSQSIFYKIPANLAKSNFGLSGELFVQGGAKLSFVPLAQNNTFSINSPWHSPSFSGGWLPKTRQVSKDGFKATWEISGLSTNFAHAWVVKANEQVIKRTITTDNPYDTMTNLAASPYETINVDFISPINNYSLVKRCVTYAFLFLIVPFLAIFLCEIWSKVRIHPVQYFLIAAADILFYLLILSISEHLAFFTSYAIATIAVCLTVFLYASAIFKGKKWGAFIAMVQFISYLTLYGILQSEDYALLMGSVLMFAVLAIIMFVTRKIDWYKSAFSNEVEEFFSDSIEDEIK